LTKGEMKGQRPKDTNCNKRNKCLGEKVGRP